MNTLEINKILSRNDVTKIYYRGCFASDQLPIGNYKLPYCMVVNIDPSDSGGTHWVAIYCEKLNSVEYYDSLGIWPPLSQHISDYLSLFTNIHYNTVQLQSSYAKSCGRHVIFFLYNRCNGISFNQIMRFLLAGRRSRSSPDEIVNEFVRKRIFENNL